MKYMFLLYVPGENRPAPGSPEARKLLEEYMAVDAAMAEAGVLIDCAPLQGPASATSVRVRDGQTLLTDGPAAEIKELLGGYTIVECADLDEALRWAARSPAALVGTVEVRPIIQLEEPV